MVFLIHVPYVWHATMFEAMWLLAGLVSTYVNFANLADAKKDRPVLEMIRRDPTVHDRHYRMIKIASDARENSQIIRIAISLLIVFSGLIGVITPNPLGGATTLTGFAITVSLLGIALLTGFKGLLDLYVRDHLLDLAQGRSPVIAAKMYEEAANEKAAKEST